MFGFSIFMNEDLSAKDIHYIKSMKQAGFKGYLLQCIFLKMMLKRIKCA